LPFLVSLALMAVAPAPAGAADRIGIADQEARMFSNPFFRALDVQIYRLIVSYDAILSGTFEVAEVDAWMRAARAARVEPLITFGHSRGCYDGERILDRKACRLPSVARYANAFEAFRDRYPDVDVYSPWNEINHRSQPTARHPKRAAEFYNLVRRRCEGCTVVAADILDQAGMASYLRAFQRYARGAPRLWGLHNYRDTNNATTAGTRRMLRLVKGRVWLTETGGIVKFGRGRPYNPERAARATRPAGPKKRSPHVQGRLPQDREGPGTLRRAGRGGGDPHSREHHPHVLPPGDDRGGDRRTVPPPPPGRRARRPRLCL